MVELLFEDLLDIFFGISMKKVVTIDQFKWLAKTQVVRNELAERVFLDWHRLIVLKLLLAPEVEFAIDVLHCKGPIS